MLELNLINDIKQLTLVEPFLDQLAEEYQLDHSLRFQLDLVLDEALTNVASYAYPGLTNQPIHLTADVVVGQLVLTITDHGIPFDPTLRPDVDIDLPIEERPIGGLGIFLIRQYMDEYSYERIGETNVQTLKKTLTPAS